MFNDIGKKIMNHMSTIYVIAIICIIISLIFDIISIGSMHYSQLEAKYGVNNAGAPILSSLFSHFLTAVGFYVGSWVLYAFGQLVDDIHAMRTLQNDGKKSKRSKEYAKNDKNHEMQVGVNNVSIDTQKANHESVYVEKEREAKENNLGKPIASDDSEKWICEKCGKSNLLGWKNCHYCGANNSPATVIDSPSEKREVEATEEKTTPKPDDKFEKSKTGKMEVCPMCGFKNPGTGNQCKKCGYWICEKCKNLNPAFKGICKECGTMKSVIQSWVCKKCGKTNPANSVSCDNCGSYK